MKKTNISKGGSHSFGSIQVGGSLPFKTASEVGYRPPSNYCRRCGTPILYCTTAADGTSIDEALLQEEMTLGVCHACYPKEIKKFQEAQAKMLGEVDADAKKTADESFEAAVEKLIEEMAEKNGTNTPTDI